VPLPGQRHASGTDAAGGVEDPTAAREVRAAEEAAGFGRR
jgi:hypothetical protein